MTRLEYGPRLQVRQLGHDEVLTYLERDRLYTASAYEYLEPKAGVSAEWWAAEADGNFGLVAIASEDIGQSILSVGSYDTVLAVLREAFLPGMAYLTFQPGQERAINSQYRFWRPQRMWRMAVNRDSFVESSVGASRLFPDDIDALNRLYRQDGYPQIQSRQLREGVYYGVWQDNRLVAAAGTHMVSPRHGMAIVGNVMTHPKHRGHGFATIVTGAVTAELLRACREVVLNVNEDNAPARRAYEKLGYTYHCKVVETAGSRRLRWILWDMVRRFTSGSH